MSNVCKIRPKLQLQSTFFVRLPRELWEVMYAYALGGQELQCGITNLLMSLYGHDANKTGAFKLRCRDARALLYVCEISPL
jgi:hypothetical protein